MGVFDGGVYRIRSRMTHDIDGHTAETHAVRYVESETEVREVVDDWREYGVNAVDISYLTYVSHGDDLGLSFGDYWGDGEDE